MGALERNEERKNERLIERSYRKMDTSLTEDHRWALQLPRSAAGAIQSLRLLPGIEVGEEGDDFLWLRGAAASNALHLQLKTLPAIGRYVWLPDGGLRQWNSRLVTARLPELAWQPLRVWAEVRLPLARLSAGLPIRSTLGLIASREGGSSNALRLSFDEWFDWAIAAPLVRLAPLAYATRPDGDTLVLGLPLPSARGTHLVEREGVILSAGYTCNPDVSMTVVRRVFGATESELVYWDASGARLLNRDLFVPANRASLRATCLALNPASPNAD